MEIPYGYCHCGCGKKTPLSPRNDKQKGWIKGEPYKFLKDHICNVRPKGQVAYRWKGGMKKWPSGRVGIYMPNHKRANGVYVLRYVLIAEKALGKALPKGVIIHHFDEIPSNDENVNLIICENDTYHKLLHQRMRALKACGNADWKKCKLCKQYDNPENLYYNKKSYSFVHRKCSSEYGKKWRNPIKIKSTGVLGDAII